MRAAQARMLEILRRVFPEASEFERYPSLWAIVPELPEDTPRHVEFWIDC